jgi:hypothetical protein
MRASLFLLLFALSSDLGCSTQVPPNGTGGRCESDDQCDRNAGLVCRCLRRKNTDDEGSDQIISPGFCQVPTFACSDSGASDAAEPDSAATDSGATDSAETDTQASDTAGDDASSDASAETSPDSTPDSD